MSTTTNRRASRRMPPRGNVKVLCRKGGLDLGVNLTLAVLDVSETGVRLVLTEPLSVAQEVSLTFTSSGSGRLIKRLANVAWVVKTADETFAAGLRFQKNLGYAELDHLARV